jgi:hypothetical protein
MVYQDSFQDKAYSFMNIGNLDGAHYGGAQAVQKSFATLAQATRNLYDPFTLYPSQYIDHYPWASEAYIFNPPMRELSNANLTIVDDVGNPYSQVDTLNITAMQIMSGLSLGKVKFFVANTTASFTTYNDCNVFYGKDLRVGDEIVFYAPALTQIASDTQSTVPLVSLLQSFSNNYTVTDIFSKDFATSAVLPIASYGTSFAAAPKILNGTMSNVYTTMNLLSQTTCNICLRSYSVQSGTIPNTRTFYQDYVIPILNKNLQATFALEIITKEPDASKITKMIPASE